MGISFHSVSVPLTREIRRIAEDINRTVETRGAWFFQVKRDKQRAFKLMEFAVRQASTMGLYRQLGINFALLSVFDALDMDVRVIQSHITIELDRCLQNRYVVHMDYSRVYIDFDDTLIIGEKVNETALRFLYQCRNRNIDVCLLTKHGGELDASLNKYCLSKRLFNEIIVLKPTDTKARHVVPDGAIFIDNYFGDREQVSRELRIPVFDVDAIECLLH